MLFRPCTQVNQLKNVHASTKSVGLGLLTRQFSRSADLLFWTFFKSKQSRFYPLTALETHDIFAVGLHAEIACFYALLKSGRKLGALYFAQRAPLANF